MVNVKVLGLALALVFGACAEKKLPSGDEVLAAAITDLGGTEGMTRYNRVAEFSTNDVFLGSYTQTYTIALFLNPAEPAEIKLAAAGVMNGTSTVNGESKEFKNAPILQLSSPALAEPQKTAAGINTGGYVFYKLTAGNVKSNYFDFGKADNGSAPADLSGQENYYAYRISDTQVSEKVFGMELPLTQEAFDAAPENIYTK